MNILFPPRWFNEQGRHGHAGDPAPGGSAMKRFGKVFFTAVLSGGALVLAGSALANPAQDCILEGKVNKARGDQGDKVYVAFRKAKRADAATDCRMSRADGKVTFRQPGASAITDAPEGAKIRYRYRENSEGEAKWELLDVIDS
jgi:hypothetical protein